MGCDPERSAGREASEFDFLYRPPMETVCVARVMHNVSAADVDTVMQISKPRCAKVCAHRGLPVLGQDPICKWPCTAPIALSVLRSSKHRRLRCAVIEPGSLGLPAIGSSVQTARCIVVLCKGGIRVDQVSWQNGTPSRHARVQEFSNRPIISWMIT